jgi:hypothetical protein
VWLDFAWLTLVAELSRRGSKVLSPNSREYCYTALGVILALFALNATFKKLTQNLDAFLSSTCINTVNICSSFS